MFLGNKPIVFSLHSERFRFKFHGTRIYFLGLLFTRFKIASFSQDCLKINLDVESWCYIRVTWHKTWHKLSHLGKGGVPFQSLLVSVLQHLYQGRTTPVNRTKKVKIKETKSGNTISILERKAQNTNLRRNCIKLRRGSWNGNWEDVKLGCVAV